ncbi:MAG: DUF2231 domain-containing protein, partial [Caldimonas sp.]
GTSVVFDLIHLVSGAGYAATVAFALIASGLVGGLPAAPFGTIDWLAIPKGTRARSIGALHGAGNVVVLVLFGVSLLLRLDRIGEPPAAAWLVSFCGAAISLMTAWLGGELVDRLGVGVSPHANVDARSSLDGPAEPSQRAPAAGTG